MNGRPARCRTPAAATRRPGRPGVQPDVPDRLAARPRRGRGAVRPPRAGRGAGRRDRRASTRAGTRRCSTPPSGMPASRWPTTHSWTRHPLRSSATRCRCPFCTHGRTSSSARACDGCGDPPTAGATCTIALALFEQFPARKWAERTREELRASGERLADAAPSGSHVLTPQELRVAELAAERPEQSRGRRAALPVAADDRRAPLHRVPQARDQHPGAAPRRARFRLIAGPRQTPRFRRSALSQAVSDTAPTRARKSSAVWATSAQPWSIVRECPRFGMMVSSVIPGFFAWIL